MLLAFKTSKCYLPDRDTKPITVSYGKNFVENSVENNLLQFSMSIDKKNNDKLNQDKLLMLVHLLLVTFPD